jgi:hypothetical protein
MQNAHFPPRRCDISVDLSATLMEHSYAFFPSRLRADRNFHRHFLHRFLTLPLAFPLPMADFRADCNCLYGPFPE